MEGRVLFWIEALKPYAVVIDILFVCLSPTFITSRQIGTACPLDNHFVMRLRLSQSGNIESRCRILVAAEGFALESRIRKIYFALFNKLEY